MNTPRNTRLEISKEYLKFSSAHFTIFSATERERLHGHNYTVATVIEAPVGDNGMCFSYGLIKKKLGELCDSIDEYMHLPADSPYLSISEEGDEYRVGYNGEEMRFLKADTLLLPIRNTTVEEYSWYLLQRLLEDTGLIAANDVSAVSVTVSSGPGQSGSSDWQR